MTTPITDGLTLLRMLRDSGTPRKVLDLALPVVSENPDASAELVLKALQDGGAKEGSLLKAIQLMQTGEIDRDKNEVDPLEALAVRRGDPVIEHEEPDDSIVSELLSQLADLQLQLQQAKEEAAKAKADAEMLLEEISNKG